MMLQPMAKDGEYSDVRGAQGDAANEDSAGADFGDILDVVDLPIIVVDRDFTVAHFNRAATATLGLKPSDIGRPPRDIQLLAGVTDLDELCAQATAGGAPRRLEVRDGERWFILRIAPYTRSNRQIGGAVLTFTNVSAFRAIVEQAIYEREYTKAILNTVTEPLVVLDADLRVQTANRAFYEMFQVSREETQGVLLYDLRNHDWDTPWLWTTLKETLSCDESFQTLEVEHDFPAIGRRTVLIDACRLSREGDPRRMILLAFRDITERKRAEEALRESERRFREMIDMMPAAIYTTDAEGRITHFNPAAVEFSGRTPELGTDSWCVSWKLYWPDGTPLPHDQCPMAMALKEGKPVRGYEAVAERPDGSRINFVPYPTPLRDGDGRVVGAINMLVDITERKQAEEALRESEERFHRMLEKLPVAAYTCDSEGLITYFNPRAVEVWGGAPKLNDAENRFCGSFRLYSSDGTPVSHDQCWMALAIEKDEAYEGKEIMIERPDGSQLTALARVNPIHDAAGKLLGAVNIVVDISDRKQAEVVMAQMAAIVESSDDAIISKDLNGVVTSWNKGAEKLFGYAAEEAIGKPITIIFPPDRLDEEPQILERLRRGERIEHYETVRRCKDGHEIDISLTISPIRNKAGKIIGASKIARDISERKRVEIEREEMLLKESAARAEAEAARAEAEAANRSKDEFLAVVSHELRSPLNAILGYNRMLREQTPDAARLKLSCGVIERSAKTQLQLIEDLLDSARIASGKLRLELRPLDVNHVIADALDVVRPAAEAKGVRLRVAEKDDSGPKESAIRDPQPAIVRGDAARLQQIIWNLLSNAIKFTPAGGSVELRVERAEGHVRIIVSDTGDGIPPEFLPRVFDRFRQADPSGSQRFGGLGLGLALVKHLVELHGGEVEAASEGAGRGSTFTVTLPMATQSELVAAESPALALAAGADGQAQTQDAIRLPAGITIAGLRVLVVDDQEEARALLAEFLGRYGAVVMTASSGAEALAILSDLPGGARPDILVCDIAMPTEDGYTALRRMRALEEARGVAASQRIPAVALTALAGNEERLRAIRSGFQAHVVKPADPVELILVIDSIAGMWRRRAESN